MRNQQETERYLHRGTLRYIKYIVPYIYVFGWRDFLFLFSVLFVLTKLSCGPLINHGGRGGGAQGYHHNIITLFYNKNILEGQKSGNMGIFVHFSPLQNCVK